MYNKLNIDYQITTSINDLSDYVSSNMESKIISKENEKLYIKYTNKYKVNISLDGRYKFNEELYPSYIKLNENLKVSFIPNNDIVELSDNISTSGALDV
jgi:membrane-bound inhibitor of C-type lysozyme